MTYIAAITILTVLPAATPDFPVTLTDARGVTVTLARAPKRIVSLMPSATECLFAVGAGPQVVGVTRFCDYPPAAKTKPKVGGFVDFSVEKVVSLSPDLVVAARGNSRAPLDQLGKLGVKVFTFDTQTAEDIIAGIETLGRLTGQRIGAQRVVAEIRGNIAWVQKRLGKLTDKDRPKVFFGGYAPPFFTPGKGTFLNDLIELAGGRNIAAHSPIRWPQLSLEQIVSQNPDVIIYGFRHATGLSGDATSARARFGSNPVWRSVAAVRNGRVYPVPEDLFMRPTPRLFEALKLLAACIHPDKFPQTPRRAKP